MFTTKFMYEDTQKNLLVFSQLQGSRFVIFILILRHATVNPKIPQHPHNSASHSINLSSVWNITGCPQYAYMWFEPCTWKCCLPTFELSLARWVQLMCLSHSFNQLLYNNSIMKSNITRVYFQVIVTAHSSYINFFVWWSLKIWEQVRN